MNVSDFAKKLALENFRERADAFTKKGVSGGLRWKIACVDNDIVVTLWQIGDPDHKVRYQKTYRRTELI